jgi:UDP-N-acetylmuramate--alanine ligase
MCYDDKNLKLLINKIKTRNILTYSIKNKKADVLIFDIIQNKLKTSFKLNIKNKIIHSSNYKFTINAIGNHNILNATASIIAAKLNGIKNKDINNALINYVGVKRRFSFIGKKNKSFVYDDYAHHPTEIAATLSAAKSLKNKVIVVFQPHRYTRTKILIREFIKVLSKVDYLFLLETYSAGEKIIKGATSKDLYSKILKKNKNTSYLKNIGDLNKLMKPHTMNQNTIVFMGAGSISSIAKKYLNS